MAECEIRSLAAGLIVGAAVITTGVVDNVVNVTPVIEQAKRDADLVSPPPLPEDLEEAIKVRLDYINSRRNITTHTFNPEQDTALSTSPVVLKAKRVFDQYQLNTDTRKEKIADTGILKRNGVDVTVMPLGVVIAVGIIYFNRIRSFQRRFGTIQPQNQL